MSPVEAEIERLKKELSEYASANTNLRNDLVLCGMAREAAESRALSIEAETREACASLCERLSDCSPQFIANAIRELPDRTSAQNQTPGGSPCSDER